MSEKLFLIITVVFMSIAAIGPSMLGLHLVPAFICSLVPVVAIPFMLKGVKEK